MPNQISVIKPYKWEGTMDEQNPPMFVRLIGGQMAGVEI
jgi:hypothetical protein